MFKKIAIATILILLIAGAFVWYKFFRSDTRFQAKNKFILIYTKNATKEAVINALKKDSICNTGSFNWLAGKMGYWDKIKPGRYKIPQGSSVYKIVEILRSGNQTPVDFVISRKIRTKEDFARLVGNYFEADSSQMLSFLNNKDSLEHYKLDSTNWMTAILHNTYSIPWTWPPSKIFKKIYTEQEKFWNNKNRKEKALQLGYTPLEIYTLASIVAEETNIEKDKSNIASVYLNRLEKGMKLQADPTVKFALKDFQLKRILFTHLAFQSPYNTYLNTGLPPGPICTVSSGTIDSVLNAPKTDYLYFIANPDLKGGSLFSATIQEHQKLAKQYHDSLTVFLNRKAALEKIKLDSVKAR